MGKEESNLCGISDVNFSFFKFKKNSFSSAVVIKLDLGVNCMYVCVVCVRVYCMRVDMLKVLHIL